MDNNFNIIDKMVNLINTVPYLLVFVVTFVVTLVITLLITQKKCPSENAQIGFGKYSLKDNPNTLQLSKLQSVNIIDKGPTSSILFTNPVWFPNGIKVYMDKVLVDIPSKTISNDVEKMHDLLPLQDVIFLVSGNVEISDKIKNSVEHYIQLISEFLAHNPDAKEKWSKTLDYLGKWLQGARGSDLGPVPTVPSIDEVYNWMKYILSNIGGISGIVKRFQKRIKLDFIQSIANGDSEYRKVDVTDTVPSGKCTIYPLSWWQSCPPGTKPVGSRGWDKDGACNKWYQHLSGELLCGKYKSNYEIPVGGTCIKVINFIDKVNQPDVKNAISVTVTTILSGLSMIPSTAPVVVTINSIIKIAMENTGDFSWLVNDLKDVCYNFTCDPAPVDNKVCGGTKKYCVSSVSDDTLASRDCSYNKNCFTKPAGKCTDDKPVNNLASLSFAIGGNENKYFNFSEFL